MYIKYHARSKVAAAMAMCIGDDTAWYCVHILSSYSVLLCVPTSSMHSFVR